MPQSTLIIGIGSPNADDQAGLRIAERLAVRAPTGATVRIADSPARLLDWLDGFDALVVCDAFHSADAVGTIRQWRWPADEIENSRFSGSHDMSLAAVLALAERLDRLPSDVTIFGIAISDVRPIDELSPAVAEAIDEVVNQINRAIHVGQAFQPD